MSDTHNRCSVPPTAGARSHLSGLVAAHRAITGVRSPAALPDRIAESARVLFDASGAGFAVIGNDDDIVEWAGDPGIGVRVAAVPGPSAQRLRQLGTQGLLAAPVLLRGDTYGELYVEAPADQGADDHLLTMLAATAGTAIENALLYEEARRSKDWLRASGEIARGILAEGGPEALMDVVSRALHVADAHTAALIVPTADGMLRVAATAGSGGAEFSNVTIDPANSKLGAAVSRGQSMIADLSQVMRDGYQNPFSYGPVMVAPLVDARGVRGAVVLCRSVGRASFTPRDLDLAAIFADQVALALEMDDARMRGELISVLEDRHRIAEALHDNVMQRLFATGVGLQSLPTAQLPAETARRLGRYVADLDETIDEIRTQIFGLRDDDALVRPSRFPRLERDSGG